MEYTDYSQVPGGKRSIWHSIIVFGFLLGFFVIDQFIILSLSENVKTTGNFVKDIITMKKVIENNLYYIVFGKIIIYLPVLLSMIIILTNDIYFSKTDKEGKLKKGSKGNRIIATLIFILSANQLYVSLKMLYSLS